MRIIYSVLGFFYLWIRYRNEVKVKSILREKYDGSYYYAGADIFITFNIIIMLLLVLSFMLITIFRVLNNAIA